MNKIKQTVSKPKQYPRMIPLPVTEDMFQRLKAISTAVNLSNAQTVKCILDAAFTIKNGGPTLQDILDSLNGVAGRSLRVSVLKR